MNKVKNLLIAMALMLVAPMAAAQSFDLGALLSKLTGGSELTVSKMAGTWNYAEPAVSFKSDNLLKKAGGAAASAAVKKKLAPYYKSAGFEKLVLKVEEDSTFTMSIGRINLKGTIAAPAEGSDASFKFNFMLAGKIKAASMDTYVKVSGSSMDLMFDVSKLITLMELAGNISGSSAVKGATSLLKGYDGITAGFTLKKQ